MRGDNHDQQESRNLMKSWGGRATARIGSNRNISWTNQELESQSASAAEDTPLKHSISHALKIIIRFVYKEGRTMGENGEYFSNVF